MTRTRLEPARALYTLAGSAILPWLPFRLWLRGRREPAYRAHMGERFGRYPVAVRDPVLWMHAVSLGETRAAQPLVHRLRHELPDATIVLTHMTATGRAAGRELYGDDVVQAWLPYDVPFAVRAFLEHFRPRAGILLETELWPNLVALSHARGVPLFVVNARLSEHSARRYARIAPLARPMFERIAGVAAQTDDDARRMRALGARAAVVTGNLKFDAAAPSDVDARAAALRALYGGRRVLLFASTRDGEEELLVDALAADPIAADVLIIVVPRHPQRFAEVAALLHARGIRFVRRSESRAAPRDAQAMLGDSMGELFAYYAACDVAFVGGSIRPFGGQNLIEALAVGAPVIVGPSTFNFEDAAAAAIAAGAARRVADAPSLVREARVLLDDAGARASMSEAGRRFVAAHRGATDRTWHWLAPQLARAMAHATSRAPD